MLSSNPSSQDIFQAHLFEEPLVPIGGESTPAENAALAAALLCYSKRSRPDDFSSLTGFLDASPGSYWNAALLTNLGLEYYHTGHYSKALDAWGEAWERAKTAADLKGNALAGRAFGELVYMSARLGRMTELQALLKSVEHRVFSGPATEKICGAREGLWTMQKHPEIAFRCGPLALHRIKVSVDPQNPGTELIQASASTRDGFSLLKVAELSQKLDLHFQMAFREKDAAFVAPAVAHLNLGHYAAVIRQEGNRYLLQDPTFGTDHWITTEALQGETSGYFLIPPGDLPRRWRAVEAQEGEMVWGKGQTTNNDGDPHGPCDPHTPGGGSCPKNDDDCKGMAVPRVHLMLVSLNINDDPVGYSPPVGPPVRFMVRYNQREGNQTGNLNYSNFGPKWTFDWLSYITDKQPTGPGNPARTDDVSYYIMGGGTRRFIGFVADPVTPDGSKGTYSVQQFDQTKLKRTSPDSYEMLSRDGTKKVFSKPDAAATSRKVFLQQLFDPFGNAVSLHYDAALRIDMITDALGQVTTVSYDDLSADIFKIRKVTDPFHRSATFGYDSFGRLTQIVDVIGTASEFTYDVSDADGHPSDFIVKLTTPYGDTKFTKTEPGNTRSLEITYPDGERERVEYNQSTTIPASDPAESLPSGVATRNGLLSLRNTFYWGRQACALAYGDYIKAKIYHWLHRDFNTTGGILESVKEPLEGRVWYDYDGQPPGPDRSIFVGSSNRPLHIGRVLDDGSPQVYSYEYHPSSGNVTKEVDPIGRTFSYNYADDGIDLLETRQTRAGQSELISQTTYNTPHLPHTQKDSAGRTTIYTYNERGQVLTETNARTETKTYHYDRKGFSTIPVNNGFLSSIEGPLPGAVVAFTYDSFGRVSTKKDVDGYTVTFDYDDLDRLTKITYPDSSFDKFTYDQADRLPVDRTRPLDLTLMLDRAGRQTSFEYDSVRQMTKRTDPLSRTTLFEWCKCGALRRLTDPMGRTTTWRHDVQGRVKCKEYADGSRVTYLYEDTTSRLRQRVDEKFQVTQYTYNRDNTLSGVSYANAAVATSPVAFGYDPDYARPATMTDGTGTTFYEYVPIDPVPILGAGRLSTVDGPLPNDTIAFGYDELGRRVSTAINGVAATLLFDEAGRVVSETNALGTFTYSYDGSSFRKASQSSPNGQRTEFLYGDHVHDHLLENITTKNETVPISEFIYGHDVPTGLVTSWIRKPGVDSATTDTFTYDDADQLKSASVSQGATILDSFIYSYDFAGNRSTEQVGPTTTRNFYNALNELTSGDGGASVAATYRWDAEQRLVAVDVGNQSTRFIYDGLGRRVGIRRLMNNSEVSDRRFVWCNNNICGERTPTGVVSKRLFTQGMKIENGPMAGIYFYTRDHLGSVRELTDRGGNIRARYSYDPFGRRTRVTGDLDADFGFAGMFWSPESALNLTRFRAYAPDLARWLSRDPFPSAEELLGPNLYAYASNDPVNRVDPYGLFFREPSPCEAIAAAVFEACEDAGLNFVLCSVMAHIALVACKRNPNPPPNLCLAPTPGPGPGPEPDNGAGGGGDFAGGGSSDSY